jgi:hypothetical protein
VVFGGGGDECFLLSFAVLILSYVIFSKSKFQNYKFSTDISSNFISSNRHFVEQISFRTDIVSNIQRNVDLTEFTIFRCHKMSEHSTIFRTNPTQLFFFSDP